MNGFWWAGGLALLAMSIVALVRLGHRRWRRANARQRGALCASLRPSESERSGAMVRVDLAVECALPAVVERFFRASLGEQVPVVDSVLLQQRGRMRLQPKAGAWRPFEADQLVVTQRPAPRSSLESGGAGCGRRPGFLWSAQVRMAPGLPALVRDAYCAGEGLLHAELLGLLTVADARGTGEIAEAELMRYLAEAAWYPTALLPSQGVIWRGIDEQSAQATLVDGASRASMLFTFDEAARIVSVSSPSRYRGQRDGRSDLVPWEGLFFDEEMRSGMRIPTRAEVAWLLPEGRFCYWQGELVAVSYGATDAVITE